MEPQNDYQQGRIRYIAAGWYMAEDLVELLPQQMLKKIARLYAKSQMSAQPTVNETRISNKETP